MDVTGALYVDDSTDDVLSTPFWTRHDLDGHKQDFEGRTQRWPVRR